MFKSICVALAEQIAARNEYDCIVPVMRGGMTAAHIIAKELNWKTGAYWPNEKLLSLPQDCKSPVFVEDLVAKSRTYKALKFHFLVERPEMNYAYVPILIDGDTEEFIDREFPMYGMITKHWIVFPYEDFDKMKEGDHGLFREGTDSYGK